MNNEKAKLLATHTPKPNASKHLKKQHLLSASLNTTPQAATAAGSLIKEKKSSNYVKKNKGAVDTTGQQLQQQSAVVNPAMSEQMAAALHYHQLYAANQVKSEGMTPQKPAPFGLINNGANPMPTAAGGLGNQYPAISGSGNDMMEEDEHDIENNAMVNGGGGAAAAGGALMNANLEFECAACEKKFKYYCYYKRHMDACHSDMPKYVCETCNKSYKWEASFRQHLRSHHNAPQAVQQLNGMMQRNGPIGGGGAGGGGQVTANLNGAGDEDCEDEEEDEEEELELRAAAADAVNPSGVIKMLSGEALCIEPVTTTIVTTNEEDEEEDEDEDDEEDEEDEGEEEDEDEEIDSQEQDIEQQICQSQNENKAVIAPSAARDSDAASTLASIADSINAAIMNNVQ